MKTHNFVIALLLGAASAHNYEHDTLIQMNQRIRSQITKLNSLDDIETIEKKLAVQQRQEIEDDKKAIDAIAKSLNQAEEKPAEEKQAQPAQAKAQGEPAKEEEKKQAIAKAQTGDMPNHDDGDRRQVERTTAESKDRRHWSKAQTEGEPAKKEKEEEKKKSAAQAESESDSESEDSEQSDSESEDEEKEAKTQKKSVKHSKHDEDDHKKKPAQKHSHVQHDADSDEESDEEPKKKAAEGEENGLTQRLSADYFLDLDEAEEAD